ncbi:RnfH family protein [Candidatus Pantoea carbekii]|uniref:UPF0125 protein HHS_04250 n=1 Tax=Candidatus Pantoea carbekii TaxID=1235990 RepID=U3U649_9GAMM|nr:RnfH family protein [Candidatus Pantoea carbekii]AKC31881.1 hypothetical protein BMSBPS_0050 [Candidatus Pantoea carbekii]BAO00395.1 hypothetical protein HHS_04250 [Candidatus Pantoea carbekii]
MSNITVEVIYALPDKQYVYSITLKKGATVQQAIETSGLLLLRQDIQLHKNKIGIFSRLVTLDYLIENGDRIEIYRPLITDPKEMRRQRAQYAKTNNTKKCVKNK